MTGSWISYCRHRPSMKSLVRRTLRISCNPLGRCKAARSEPGPLAVRHSLNIAHVNERMEMGGSEKLTATLCRLQRSCRHNASLNCLYSVGVLGKELQAEGFEVTLHQPPSPFGLMRSLYRKFKSFTPDVVHCHNPTAAVLAALPARLAGVNTVIV